jgi:peroxiredoxin
VRAFGITQEFRGFKEVARRSAFLVDGAGTVRSAWVYENSELPDVDVLLAACRDLQTSGRPG